MDYKGKIPPYYIMRKTFLFLFALALAGHAVAQVDSDEYQKQLQRMREQYAQQRDKARQQYDAARSKAEADYAAFRKKANADYAEAVQRAWQQMGVQPAVPKPAEPKPPQPAKPDPAKTPTTKPLPQAETVPPPVVKPAVPTPAIPAAVPEAPTMQFEMYGAACSVHTDISGLRFSLPSVDEQSVAAAWQQLSQERYNGLLHDCLAERDALGLADWGYLQLLGNMSERLLGKGSNEAVLLQMYLLAQSGYRVRMARVDTRLVLLMPFNRTVYGYSYLTSDGINHYLITREKIKSVEVCSVAFPREQVANILMSRMPDLGDGKRRSRTVQAERFGTMKATVSVDERLMDFLRDYPLSDAWDYYALAGLSDSVKSTLYPALRSQLAGMSNKKAALMLLDFVQTGFDYATDQDQFGYERPLFGDESFFYPKNDCEDRSILYCILVRDLLGLDVVLVNWPGHIATAVAFPEAVEGDYFTIDGRRYTICDPTYIGANVGMTMPQFQGVGAKLIKL